MRWLRAVARVLGWLLTPFVAWAASFVGTWFAAAMSPGVTSTAWRIGILIAVGAISAITATLLWLRLLRRSPELQEALAVHPDGTPLAADGDPTT